jgi:hypothetical protein
MSHPAPADVMRHRGRALVVESIRARGADTLECTASDAGPWRWPRMLEGAAQTAGLLAGMLPGGPARSVVAQLLDVVVRAETHRGPLRFVAAFDRRVLHFWRCHFEVRDADGGVLLEGRVTLAPDPVARAQ